MSRKIALDLGAAIARKSRDRPERVSLTLRVDPALYERLGVYALRRRRSHQDVMENALRDYLDAHERSETS